MLPFDPDVNGPVRALALTGSTLYLGGQFQNINGALAALLKPRNNLAAVDATTGLGLPWDPNADGRVNALAFGGDTVFAGGEFATVNGSTSRLRLAAFDVQTGIRARLGAERRRAGAGARAPRADGVRRRRLHEREWRRAAVGFRCFRRTDRRTGPRQPRPGHRGAQRPAAPRHASGHPGRLAGAGTVHGRELRDECAGICARRIWLSSACRHLPTGGGPGPGAPGDDTDPNLALAASRRRFGVGGPERCPSMATRPLARRARKGTTLQAQPQRARASAIRGAAEKPGPEGG